MDIPPRFSIPWEPFDQEARVYCADAFTLGFVAAREDREDCPYPDSSPKLLQAWADGWYHGLEHLDT